MGGGGIWGMALFWGGGGCGGRRCCGVGWSWRRLALATVGDLPGSDGKVTTVTIDCKSPTLGEENICPQPSHTSGLPALTPHPPPHHAPEQGLETQPQAQKAPRPPDSLNHYASDNEEAQCSATPLDGEQAGRAVTAPQSVS